MNRSILMAVMWSAGLLTGCGVSSAAESDGQPLSGAIESRMDAGVDAGLDAGADGGIALAHEDARRIDHLARAHELERTGDVSGALVESRRAAFDRPNHEALEAIARLALQRHERGIALASLRDLADLDVKNPEPLVRLAQLQLDAKESGKAEAAASEAVERDPRSADAWHLLGRAQLQQGASSDAATAFERAVRLNPRNSWAWNNLGYAQLQSGRPEKAVTALEKARELAPHLAYVLNNLGVAYEQLGRLDEAQLAYGKALELEPSHPNAAANFARTAEGLGWAGPSVEPGPDAGAVERSGSEWSLEEFAPATTTERSWLMEAGAKNAADEPSGWDLRDDPGLPPMGIAGFETPERD